MDDMKRSSSESALVWNSIYPRAQPTLSLADLLQLRPLWGSSLEPISDDLVPFYWGYDQIGKRLPRLDGILETIDGPGPKTEVDLFLLGEHELVVVEAKHMSGLGRCGRYGSKRCPEIHLEPSAAGCQYWTSDE